MASNQTDTIAREQLGGLRLTKQRRVVYEVLMDGKRDHPTAAEVFERAKVRMPSISLATVYNCLETLTQVGAVKQVNLEREASRFCPNLNPHGHFYCSECQSVADVPLEGDCESARAWNLPDGTQLQHIDVTMKGVCPKCSEKKTAS